MRKIAVVFPGVGYNKDRPLLYYSGKMAVKNGYELISIDFSGLEWSKEKLKDADFLRTTLEICLARTGDALSDIGDLKADDVVFISKSIGTVVATAYAHSRSLDVKQICFSPLEMIEDHVTSRGTVLFCGDADPYADHGSLERIARDKGIEIISIGGGNHSLETGDILTDIDNLKTMMTQVSKILSDPV